VSGRAVVVDIEGTTSATAFVYETLYPYARTRLGDWLRAHPSGPERDQVRALAGEADADEDRIAWWLEHWSDVDEKATPLKTIQGEIWDDGFARGELTSHFYPDVIAALRRWHARGATLWVFSSGSVRAQQAWFGHTPDGDLRPLISGYFDTVNAGPKAESRSYERISATIGTAPAATVFLSDVRAELDAARLAGWGTIGIRRPGERCFVAGDGDHREAASFDDADRQFDGDISGGEVDADDVKAGDAPARWRRA
jgi:enolase-phosphatase E1